jgi:hypothetical protein
MIGKILVLRIVEMIMSMLTGAVKHRRPWGSVRSNPIAHVTTLML